MVMVTIEDEQKLVRSLSNGAVFNDLEWPLTLILRACHYSTLNISETVKTGTRLQRNSLGLLIGTYKHPSHRCKFE